MNQQPAIDSSNAPFSKLNNLISSINAYADMSPDLTIRRQVNETMQRRARQPLSISTWCQTFSDRTYRSHNTDSVQSMLAFIYESFSQYSGLDFSRVRPSDRLNDDLCFPLVCWFDWSITFCEDFYQRFGLDLSDRFDETNFETIGELVSFLIKQISLQPANTPTNVTALRYTPLRSVAA
ncbi:MAG: hypothetical protein WBA76_05005 [Phormidesmis sp.]